MYDYAIVHLVYTIPLAIALSVILGPLLNRRDIYKICFLQVIAITYTIPWDSYLIKNRIWTYPQDAIIGPTLFEIPAEEVFFFSIQTYITTCLQILLNKSVVVPTYLHNENDPADPIGSSLLPWKRAGQVILALLSIGPIFLRDGPKEGQYLRLILAWACPVTLALWTFGYQLLLTLSWTKTLLPIAAPTLYLWIVDTLALRRGTWSIELGTKLGIHVWPHLEIEEALFFLVTNALIVWGSTAFDNAMAILDAFPEHFSTVPGTPSPPLMLKALFMSPSKYNTARLEGLQNALTVLAKKSRSFYLASGVFTGRLRIDLILLYAFCRVADDLIDDAPSVEDADKWVQHFTEFLDAKYSSKQSPDRLHASLQPFPPTAQSILKLLPTDKLPSGPLYSLLDGFRMDMKFFGERSKEDPPIKTFADLERYASCVAGTIGELCLNLVYFHDPDREASDERKRKCVDAGFQMGRALQYVNIVRDVKNDADVGRCYIPSSWYKRSAGNSPRSADPQTMEFRKKILDTAFEIYAQNRDAIEELPYYARGGIRVAVESYMEIGRVMRERIRQGAGAGGIASAARLAKAGFRVTIVEKNDHTGGRCSLIHDNGYRFDQGPSLLLLPDLFREVFTDLDTSLEAEGVELLKCEPNYNVWFGDGECIELSTDAARMKKTIEKWEGKEGFERYLAWMKEAHVHYEASVVHVLRKNFGTIWAMARPSFLPYLMSLHPFESIWNRASRYFLTERLRRAFTFGSMYMGMSPFEAPGTYSLLQYTELAEGIWYPRGGFHKVLDALVTVGKRLGVDYRLSTPVAQVNVDRFSQRATGVTLASGEVLNADLVLVNADLVYAYNELLPLSSRAKALSKKPASCSSLSFYWSMDKMIPELHTHNVFLADDYKDSFDDIFKRQQIPKEPSFYVNVPSRVDPSAAPEGRDTVVVLVPCGHLVQGEGDRVVNTHSAQDWQAMIAKARHAVFETIRLRTGADLQSHVSHEIINTPVSWKERFNLDRGAILGLSHSFWNVLSFRPKTKHADIGGLYFVGASTHPGTGVPIVLCGSKITTEQILDDLGMAKPWYPGGHKRRVVSELDKEGRRPLDLMNTLVVMVFVLVMLIYVIGFT